MFEVIPLDKATRAFNLFMKTVSYIQRETALTRKTIKDPSILPPARIYKHRVIERMKGYPVSSRFFGEDRIATAIAVKLGFRYKFSRKLKLLKIDEPGYDAYWRKHYRYNLGVHRDVTELGRQILRGYIVARRLHHVNVVLPIFSLLYALVQYRYSKNLKEAVGVALMKYFIDVAMLYGDLVGAFTER